MRQIIFDTETTGMNFNSRDKSEGHRIVELGCVELIDRTPTDNTLHLFFNPGQPVDEEAVAVHGITNEFLADYPTFAEQLPEILAYLDGADELIAHNMPFDQSFLNRELNLAGENWKLENRFTLTDTLQLAKKRFPGKRGNSLDALCNHFGIDNSSRTKHGALLDSELLLEVYLKLTGGQEALFTNPDHTSASAKNSATQTAITTQPDTYASNTANHWLPSALSDAERQAHDAILATLKK